MLRVHIIGAGSIGNHLAHACRTRGWDVAISDIDPAALRRTRESIFPSRYGRWDDSIRLIEGDVPDHPGDVVVIGTPPDTHLPIARDVLARCAPRVLLIEKPLATPDLNGCSGLWDAARTSRTVVLVGYNHTLTRNTQRMAEILRGGKLGDPRAMNVQWLEHWGGIFSAHPWLAGPRDSYLGFASRGGGACGEHSHAINLWQYASQLVGAGKVVEVSATMDIVDDGTVRYDRVTQISLRTESGLIGSVIQDVVTRPPLKALRLQCSNGFVEWYANYRAGEDALRHAVGSDDPTQDLFAKTRPDDFVGEIVEIDRILKGQGDPSPIGLESGLDTMLVIAAAHRSAATGRTVSIDYTKGYGPQSLMPGGSPC